MLKPVFDFNIRKDGVTAVLDHGTGGSVTNGAEVVIATLAAAGAPTRRVIYRDSVGQWDGLSADGGTFLGFIMLHSDDEDDAAAAALSYSDEQWRIVDQ